MAVRGRRLGLWVAFSADLTHDARVRSGYARATHLGRVGGHEGHAGWRRAKFCRALRRPPGTRHGHPACRAVPDAIGWTRRLGQAPVGAFHPDICMRRAAPRRAPHTAERRSFSKPRKVGAGAAERASRGPGRNESAGVYHTGDTCGPPRFAWRCAHRGDTKAAHRHASKRRRGTSPRERLMGAGAAHTGPDLRPRCDVICPWRTGRHRIAFAASRSHHRARITAFASIATRRHVGISRFPAHRMHAGDITRHACDPTVRVHTAQPAITTLPSHAPRCANSQMDAIGRAALTQSTEHTNDSLHRAHATSLHRSHATTYEQRARRRSRPSDANHSIPVNYRSRAPWHSPIRAHSRPREICDPPVPARAHALARRDGAHRKSAIQQVSRGACSVLRGAAAPTCARALQGRVDRQRERDAMQ